MKGLGVISGSQLHHLRKHIGKPVIVADNGDLILVDERTHKVDVLRGGAADYVPLIAVEGLDRARTYWACMEALSFGADGAHERIDAIEEDALNAANDLLDEIVGGWPVQAHDERLTEVVQCQAIRDFKEGRPS